MDIEELKLAGQATGAGQSCSWLVIAPEYPVRPIKALLTET